MKIFFDKRYSKRLLFINYEGKLKALYVPFQVLCIRGSGLVKANTIVYVEAIACTEIGELLYIINGVAYHYSFFYLVAKF